MTQTPYIAGICGQTNAITRACKVLLGPDWVNSNISCLWSPNNRLSDVKQIILSKHPEQDKKTYVEGSGKCIHCNYHLYAGTPLHKDHLSQTSEDWFSESFFQQNTFLYFLTSVSILGKTALTQPGSKCSHRNNWCWSYLSNKILKIFHDLSTDIEEELLEKTGKLIWISQKLKICILVMVL